MATVDLPVVVEYLFNMLTQEQKTPLLAKLNAAPVSMVDSTVPVVAATGATPDATGALVAPAAPGATGGNKRTRKNKGGDNDNKKNNDKKNDDKKKDKKRNNK